MNIIKISKPRSHLDMINISVRFSCFLFFLIIFEKLETRMHPRMMHTACLPTIHVLLVATRCQYWELTWECMSITQYQPIYPPSYSLLHTHPSMKLAWSSSILLIANNVAFPYDQVK